MDSFEYAMGLISIVVGLAIGAIATSFHKLIRHRRTIKWDARALLAAALTFVLLFSMWFDTWTIHRRPEILAYPFLLSLVIELLLLFLMATSVLPDDPPPDLDLATFYEENGRAIWAFFLLFQVSYVAHWFYFTLTSPLYTPARLLAGLPETLAVPIITVALMLAPRRRALHLAVIALFLGYWLWNFWDHRISA